MTHSRVASQEEERARLRFQAHVIQSAARIEKEIHGLGEVIFALQGLFRSSEIVTSAEFATFAEGPTTRLSAIRAMAWAPHLPPKAGADEACAFRSPLMYVHPRADRRLAIGSDLAGDARMRAAMEMSAHTDEPTISDALPTIGASGGERVMALCLVVKATKAQTVALGSILGYVLVTFGAEEVLMGPMASGIDPATMQFQIADGAGNAVYATADYDAAHRPGHAQAIQLAAQRWTLRGQPTATYLAGQRSNDPLLFGALAALSWLILAGLAWFGMYRARHRALEQQARFIRKVLGSLHEGVVVADRDGKPLYSNEAATRISGLEFRSTVPGTWSTTFGFYEEDKRTLRPERQLPLARALRGEEVPPEDVWLRNDGRTRGSWVGASASPLRGDDGEVEGGVCVFRDVTWRRVLEAQRVEMRVAAEVQKNLYPNESPNLPGFDLAGAVYSAEATCGDYFDFIRLDDHRVAIAVGDVSGHGLGPALIMTQVRAYVRGLAKTTKRPNEILSRLNEMLAEDLEASFFVTMILAVLDTRTHRIEWANAGHIGARVLGADGCERGQLDRTGIPLSIFDDSEYPSMAMNLQTGDTVCFFTDGVTESRATDDEMLSEEGAMALVREARAGSACEIVAHIHEQILKRAGGRPQNDDVTMVILKDLGSPVHTARERDVDRTERRSGLHRTASGRIRIHQVAD